MYMPLIVDSSVRPSAATGSDAGVVKLYSSAGSNTDGAMSQNATTTALNNKLDTASSNYIKNVSITGRTVTLTFGDDSEQTVITQDNDTTYEIGTANAAGVTKLYSGTGTNVDGTMTQNAINNEINTLNTKIEAVGSFHVSVVSTLPEEGESSVIYFVPEENSGENQQYIEYIWMDDAGYFESIGVSNTDLTNYYNKSEIDTKISNITNGTVAVGKATTASQISNATNAVADGCVVDFGDIDAE
jgi:hypothetical protein